MALPRIDAPGPRPVAPVDPAHAALPVGDARQEVFDRSLASLLGRTVPVAVLAKMSDGTFLVRVAGNPARMALPEGAQVGTEIPLKVVPASPRPAFQLAGALPSTPLTYSATGAAAPVPGSADLAALPTADLSRVALKTGALAGPPAAPVAAGDPKTAPQLSPTGRALGDVMGAALKLPMPTEARIATAPIATAPTADTRQIADGLQHAIDKSGMFYESHLAEWAGGERPLAELKGEPQMATGRNAMEAVKPGVATDPATAQLISQQLSTQEQSRVAWQGQLWPGQAMQWDIARDAPEGNEGQGDDGAQTPWRSKLTLRFAALGELGAQIVMAGDQVHIRLQAGSDASGEVLRAYASRLQDALAAAGTPAATLAILDPQAAAAPAETAPVNPGAAAYAQQHD
ncbi:flagellar hook-length control protein FliK [Massilia sp. S19_KUP03_FR1]|uniref:flagellar hook-length control protein FliK n=1 Tax=Massilia sp. S19_KUP03_FR1 TaxID=3025503 RepID=UPI002FCD76DF